MPQEYKPELYPPRISEKVQMGLWWAGIGIFCGFVWGFAIGVMFF